MHDILLYVCTVSRGNVTDGCVLPSQRLIHYKPRITQHFFFETREQELPLVMRSAVRSFSVCWIKISQA